jgi:hypothetical protein
MTRQRLVAQVEEAPEVLKAELDRASGTRPIREAPRVPPRRLTRRKAR